MAGAGNTVALSNEIEIVSTVDRTAPVDSTSVPQSLDTTTPNLLGKGPQVPMVLDSGGRPLIEGTAPVASSGTLQELSQLQLPVSGSQISDTTSVGTGDRRISKNYNQLVQDVKQLDAAVDRLMETLATIQSDYADLLIKSAMVIGPDVVNIFNSVNGATGDLPDSPENVNEIHQDLDKLAGELWNKANGGFQFD